MLWPTEGIGKKLEGREMKTPEFYFPSCMLTWEKIMVMPLLLLVAPDYYSVLLSVVSFYFSFFKTLIYLFIYLFERLGRGRRKRGQDTLM